MLELFSNRFGIHEAETPARNGAFLADAVEALRIGGGGYFRLRPGTYRTDREWLFNGIPNVWIEGPGAKLVFDGPDGGRLMTVTSSRTQRCEFFRIDGLHMEGGARTSAVLSVLHGPSNNVQTSLSRLRIENGGGKATDYGLVIGEGGDQGSPYTQVSEVRLRDSVIISKNQIHANGRFANVLRCRDTDFWGDGTGVGLTCDAAGPLSLVGCTAGTNATDISLFRDLNVAPILRIYDWHSESSGRFFAQHGDGRMPFHMKIDASSIAMNQRGGFHVTTGGQLSIVDSQLSGPEPGLLLEPDTTLHCKYDMATFAQNAYGFMSANSNVVLHGPGASSDATQGFYWLGSLHQGMHYDTSTRTVTVRP